MKKQYNSNPKVGYGRPPAEHQFRPGQSGNPNGRPKGAQSFKSDLRDELAELVSVRDDGKSVEVTKQRALIKVLLRMALAGELRAITTIFGSCVRAFGDETAMPTSRHLKTAKSYTRSIFPAEAPEKRPGQCGAPQTGKSQ